MVLFTFYYNIFLMGSVTLLFHHVLKHFSVETQLFDKYSVNMMRSLICGSIAHDAYIKYNYIWLDKCLENTIILHKFESFHYMFLAYFIFFKSTDNKAHVLNYSNDYVFEKGKWTKNKLKTRSSKRDSVILFHSKNSLFCKKKFL